MTVRLATIANGTRDGQLVVVSRDHNRAVAPVGIAATLQDALERWERVAPQLATLASALETGTATNVLAFASRSVLAPLPRAWQWLDGSAFESHGNLMSKVFGMDPPSRSAAYVPGRI